MIKHFQTRSFMSTKGYNKLIQFSTKFHGFYHRFYETENKFLNRKWLDLYGEKSKSSSSADS